MPCGAQLLERLAPLVLLGPRVGPHVELQQIDALDAEVLEALLAALDDPAAGKLSRSGASGGAGQLYALGGTLVAT